MLVPALEAAAFRILSEFPDIHVMVEANAVVGAFSKTELNCRLPGTGLYALGVEVEDPWGAPMVAAASVEGQSLGGSRSFGRVVSIPLMCPLTQEAIARVQGEAPRLSDALRQAIAAVHPPSAGGACAAPESTAHLWEDLDRHLRCSLWDLAAELRYRLPSASVSFSTVAFPLVAFTIGCSLREPASQLALAIIAGGPAAAPTIDGAEVSWVEPRGNTRGVASLLDAPAPATPTRMAWLQDRIPTLCAAMLDAAQHGWPP